MTQAATGAKTPADKRTASDLTPTLRNHWTTR